jgi:hypothetical protein
VEVVADCPDQAKLKVGVPPDAVKVAPPLQVLKQRSSWKARVLVNAGGSVMVNVVVAEQVLLSVATNV